jgi:hypothetical protein
MSTWHVSAQPRSGYYCTMPLRPRLVAVVTAAALVLSAASARAGIVRIEITSRAPLFEGRTFGRVGAYEEIKGVAYGEIDPNESRNALITDIQFAPRNARGLVEYRTTFTVRKPVDLSKADGVLFYEIVNRGNHGRLFQVGGDPGDGFLYARGQVVLWSGWQGDMPIASVRAGQEGIDLPTARQSNGAPIVGPVWKRFASVAAGATTFALGALPGREPATLDTSTATLISVVSEAPDGTKTGVTTIRPSDWAFADCRNSPFPGTPDPNAICLAKGADPSLLYELVYQAKDPLVLGVGMAAMRDVVSFFRYAATDDRGTPNPVASSIRWAIGFGNSQSGRFAKAFLNLGFNQDERGRLVWDGLDTYIAGMLGSFNVRFAVPGDMAELYDPGAEGPLWWADYEDRLRGRPSWGLLHRCSQTGTCPKITEVYGGPEYWYSRGTVGIVGTSGNQDLPLPANVRRYYCAGTTHGGGSGGFQLVPGRAQATGRAPGAATASPAGGTSPEAVPQPNASGFFGNPNPMQETARALYVALVEWVTKGTVPPPSAYPTLRDKTLVPANAAAMGWPKIPGVASPDGVVNPVVDYDYGPGYRYNDNSGVITKVPPPITHAVRMFVPKVDRDGNDVAGVKSLLLRVPLGTYTGWDPIASGALKGRERQLAAGYVPFARTKAERIAKGDPRLSIEERYPSVWQYVAEATRQADELVRLRLLLPEDAIRLMAQLGSTMATGGY